MSIKPENIATLTDWLGAEGALAGLDRSNLTNAELMMLARALNIVVSSKTPRRQIIIDLVMGPIIRVDKNPEDLLEMSRDELKRYFSDKLVSTKEIMHILEQLGIAPKGKLKIKLADFAANEISDLGMYQRVAKGQSK
jgi:hypothetical protein